MRPRRKPVVVRPPSAPKSEINVTPLVDVVLVLLIIFMVVTPLLERDVSVRVPATESVETGRELEKDQIVVRVDAAGALSIDGTPIAAAAYVTALSQRLRSKAAAERVVFVIPADEARYAKLVEAFDGARQAGAETLAMVTEPPAKAP